jgi:2-hydroxycyclohexanecarboxyl-CoA dehydrogenase
MELGLNGKTVLIVGGNGAIGRPTSLAFVKEGANIALASRDIDASQKIADLANSLNGGHAIAMKSDATKFKDVESAVKQTLEEFGQIDVLVHGIAYDELGSFLDLDRNLWDKIIAVNFTSVLNYFKVVLPIMIKRESGNIITMSSVMGRRGDPQEPVYGACKAGVITFSQAIAREVAPYKIRVNTVAPGPTPATEPVSSGSIFKQFETPSGELSGELKGLIKGLEAITPLGKVGKPSDVVPAVLFLASDVTAGHITGSVIGVDGGMYMPH